MGFNSGFKGLKYNGEIRRDLILILVYTIKRVGRIHFGGHISIIAPVTVVISRLRSGRSGIRIPLRERNFMFFKTSRPGMESTQPHIQ